MYQQEFAEKHGIVFFETSAKKNVNVQEAFMAAIKGAVYRTKSYMRKYSCFNGELNSYGL